jgi:hypothetical protein
MRRNTSTTNSTGLFTSAHRLGADQNSSCNKIASTRLLIVIFARGEHSRQGVDKRVGRSGVREVLPHLARDEL